MKRKMLAAREDLVDSVSALASRRGLTLFGVTNEALEQVLKVNEMGCRLSDVVREFEVFKAAKESGFVLVPEGLLYEAMERAYRENGDWMIAKWFETGEWCGKCFSLRDFEDKVDGLKRHLRGFFWNAKDLEIVDADDGAFSVRCVSPRFPESYTTFLSAFLEGVFKALGYACVERHIAKGFIHLRFSQPVKEAKVQRLEEPAAKAES
ncbi:MAG: hypothetical protein ACP5IM_01820 [Candidatus Bathyarchaeia archaeon]